MARQYGVYREKEGEAERALFVIDAKGIIRWSYVSPVGINPGADGILKALESMAKSEKQSILKLVYSKSGGIHDAHTHPARFSA